MNKDINSGIEEDFCVFGSRRYAREKKKKIESVFSLEIGVPPVRYLPCPFHILDFLL